MARKYRDRDRGGYLVVEDHGEGVLFDVRRSGSWLHVYLDDRQLTRLINDLTKIGREKGLRINRQREEKAYVKTRREISKDSLPSA